MASLEVTFREMCVKHDLTFMYSDDHDVMLAGNRSLSVIKRVAQDLDPKVAKHIWNDVVQSKLKSHHSQFYW